MALIKQEAMKKKAIIFDLDNTLYAVDSIGDKLFSALFKLFEDDGSLNIELKNIKRNIMQKPFQTVAAQYSFSETLIEKCLTHLKMITYNGNLSAFDDYKHVKKIEADKFLVTTGFTKLQQSKIKSLGIANDFKEIHIVDITNYYTTKKEVFADIIFRHNYSVDEVLVIGDDVDSEIKAAQQLGVEALLYNKKAAKEINYSTKTISDFSELNMLYTF